MLRATPAATQHLARHRLNGVLYRNGWDRLMIAGRGLAGGPAEAVAHYLQHGGNLLDAHADLEAVGTGLRRALASGFIRRDTVVLCAEGGAAEPGALRAAGLPEAEAPVAGYCLAPAFVRHLVRARLASLGVACLDLFWLTGADRLSAALPEAEFQLQLREAFAALEVAVAQGELAAYGLSLTAPAFTPEQAVAVARDVLGEHHHLRAMKLPHTALTEAWASAAAGLTLLAVGGPSPHAAAALLEAAQLTSG